ncbi:MAG: MerR family transcriptional regulator [Lachnospiraceae bacterium]|nr:MerR family transcriptional regulator [Lachnospiraceae bacterium]
MKINEVEHIVGITKKNIRFYEEQGLIRPTRNLANGYRSYTEEDAERLLKVKLLRRLNIPIEEIRRIIEGHLKLTDCLERHQIILRHEASNLQVISDVCSRMAEEGCEFADFPARRYLSELDELEKGGNRFVKVKKVDEKSRRRSAGIAAAVMILLMVFVEVLFISVLMSDPEVPLPAAIFLTGIPVIVTVGILLALRERMREIKEGEYDEALKY